MKRKKYVKTGAIRERRKGLGLTMATAATAAGWTVQRWSDIENGRHADLRLSTIFILADVLKCDPCSFLDSTPDTTRRARKTPKPR